MWAEKKDFSWQQGEVIGVHKGDNDEVRKVQVKFGDGDEQMISLSDFMVVDKKRHRSRSRDKVSK